MGVEFDNKVVKVFNYLDKERAAAIAAICKKHGGKTQRLAMGRNSTACKIRATFDKHPGWYTNSQSMTAAYTECRDAGLFNQLTFQN